MSDNATGGNTQCGHRECEEPAVAIYEGTKPPDHAFTYPACQDHATGEGALVRYLHREVNDQ